MTFINQDIEVLYREVEQGAPYSSSFRPFTIWLFEDSLPLRTETGSVVLPLSSNVLAGSNILFPRHYHDCDYDAPSLYFKHLALCLNIGLALYQRRIYLLEEIDAQTFEALFYNYTALQLSHPLNTGYIHYNGTPVNISGRVIRQIRNNIGGLIALLTQARTRVYAIHVDDFMAHPIELFHQCAEDAFKNNCNIFVDTGVCVDSATYQKVLQACYEFGHISGALDKAMFFAINLPFVTRLDSNLYPSYNRYNIIVFAGHTLMNYGKNLCGYIPASTLYANVLAYNSSEYYNSIVDRAIYYEPATNLPYNTRDIDHVRDIAFTHYVNVPYIRDGIWYFHILRTTEHNTSIKVLQSENNARFITDLNIELINRFKSLLGLIDTDDELIKKRVENILYGIMNIEWFRNNKFVRDVRYGGHRVSGRRIEINVVVRLHTTVEEIYLNLLIGE